VDPLAEGLDPDGAEVHPCTWMKRSANIIVIHERSHFLAWVVGRAAWRPLPVSPG